MERSDEIGEQNATVATALPQQIVQQRLPIDGFEIGFNDGLTAVQLAEVMRRSIGGERSTIAVNASTKGVDARHACAEFCQRQPSQWRGDEGGNLHDPQPGKNAGFAQDKFPK